MELRSKIWRQIVLLIAILILSRVGVVVANNGAITASHIVFIVCWWLVFCEIWLCIHAFLSRTINVEHVPIMRPKPPYGVVNFVVPGFLRPPREKFSCLFEGISGKFTRLITYDNQHWHRELLQDAIFNALKDIDRDQDVAKIRIFAISMGYKLVCDLDTSQFDSEVEIFAINPVLNSKSLHENLRIPLKILVPIGATIIAAIGPFGNLPLVKKDGIRHSLNEVATEGFALVFDRGLHGDCDNHRFVLNGGIAKDETGHFENLGDEFTDINAVETDLRVHGGIVRDLRKYTVIHAEHAYFTKYTDEFRDALKELDAFDGADTEKGEN